MSRGRQTKIEDERANRYSGWVVRIGLLILALMALLGRSPTRSLAQTSPNSAEARARELLARLSPKKRWGNCSWWGFQGRDVSPGTPIHTLLPAIILGVWFSVLPMITSRAPKVRWPKLRL